MMKLVLLFLSSFVSAFCVGQSFELTELVLEGDVQLNAESEYGNGLSLFDVNHDGWPDLTVCRHGLPVACLLNNEGSFTQIDLELGTPSQARHWNWVDIDNDGDADGCLTTEEGLIELYEQVGEFEFELVTGSGMVNPNEEVYSNSWGDVNGDGYLDCYIGVYEMLLDEDHETNHLYLNNGDWTFTEMGPDNPANDGYNMSFMGTFMDFDNDMDPDIFVNNDRVGSFNHLYRNENGAFTDITAGVGLHEDFYAMSNTIADYNNDGYLDIFMSNNPEGSRLMRNVQGNSFVDASMESDLFVEAFGWAGNFFDFDNDGDLDFHFCSMPFWFLDGQNQLHENDGTGVFTNVTAEASMDNQPTVTFSSAVADINNDGALDIVVYNDAPFGLQLWMNTADPGFWLEVKPTSTLGNADAVGTRIECYAGDTYQMRYTMCGENHLGQNSDYAHFGLGQHEVVDSLVVTWRSGLTHTWYNLPAGTSLEVNDMDSFDFALNAPTSAQFCEGDSLLLTTNVNEDITWSTGETGPSLTVTETGTYYAQMQVADGMLINTDSVTITVWPLPTIALEYTLAVCPWDTSFVTLDPVESGTLITWTDGELDGWPSGQIDPGSYAFTLSFESNPCVSSGQFEIPEIAPLWEDVVTTDIACHGGDSGSVEVTLGAFPGATVEWFGNDPQNLTAGTYNPLIYGDYGCGVTLELSIEEPEALEPNSASTDVLCNGEATGTGSVECSGGTPEYTFDWQGANPDALSAGAYPVVVTDANGCEAEVICVVAEPDALSADLVATGAVDGQVEVLAVVNGGTSPYEVTWTGGPEPVIGELVLLDDSYTYTVQVTDANGCTLDLSYTDITEQHAPPAIRVYPNPSSGLVYVSGSPTAGNWTLIATSGMQLQTGSLRQNQQQLDLGSLPAGVYYLRIETMHHVWVHPIVLND